MFKTRRFTGVSAAFLAPQSQSINGSRAAQPFATGPGRGLKSAHGKDALKSKIEKW